jgi:hypothetical protein
MITESEPGLPTGEIQKPVGAVQKKELAFVGPPLKNSHYVKWQYVRCASRGPLKRKALVLDREVRRSGRSKCAAFKMNGDRSAKKQEGSCKAANNESGNQIRHRCLGLQAYHHIPTLRGDSNFARLAVYNSDAADWRIYPSRAIRRNPLNPLILTKCDPGGFRRGNLQIALAGTTDLDNLRGHSKKRCRRFQLSTPTSLTGKFRHRLLRKSAAAAKFSMG